MTFTNIGLAVFSYTYDNLIINAAWNVGGYSERYWTDGYGGSLHASNPSSYGIYNISNVTPDSFTITMGTNKGSVAAVFPPKLFDFEALYGATSRPHVWFAGGSQVPLDYAVDNMAMLRSKNFGVVQLFAGHYNYVEGGTGSGDHIPVFDEDEFGRRSNYRYEWEDPALIASAIESFHTEGFKVIPYLQGYQFAIVQDKELTLDFMRRFQDEWNLDGWYFDNAGAGNNWFDHYLFLKQVRRDIGDDGIIYHHNTVDLWAGLARDGRVLVPADAYVNYTLKGETGSMAESIHSPNDLYLLYYSSGYGFAQTLGAHKIVSNGKASITRKEVKRVLHQNLNANPRCSKGKVFLDWQEVEPFYLERKQEYLSGVFSPDVIWPTDWFIDIDVSVRIMSSNTALVTWETPEASTSEVHYTIDRNFHTAEIVSNESLVTSHSIFATDLTPGALYYFRVRSYSNDKIFGGFGLFNLSN
jgi:hypothetical protein